MLLALAAAERLTIQGVEVRWALSTAAELHVVDRAELAIRLLQKFVSVQRARAAMASIREGDQPPAAVKRKRERRAPL